MTRPAQEMPVLPGFELTGRLGRGGMGEVFAAVRVGPDGFRKQVAIKQLAVEHILDRELVKRFLQEARISARLEHPNIVRVHDLLVVDNRRFLVMELLHGRDLVALEDLLRKDGPLPWWLALSVMSQALEGLAYAHALTGEDGVALGLVHRDLTPRNMFVCDSGQVKILDFGIAKITSGPSTAITRRGAVGTVEFMSPEQAQGGEADARSDLYQIGATSYYLLSGRLPHGTGSPGELLARAVNAVPTPLGQLRPDLPRRVLELLDQAMARKPWERFVDAAAMRHAVDEILADSEERGTPALARVMAGLAGEDEGHVPDELDHPPSLTAASAASARAPGRGRRVWPAVVAGALIVAAGLGAFVLGRGSSPRRAEPGAVVPADEAKPAPAVAAPSYQRLTYRNGVVFSGRFMPDGKSIAYSAAWSGGAPESVVATPGAAESRSLGLGDAVILDIAPNGELAVLLRPSLSFVFVQLGTLARATLAGGAARELIEDVQWAEWNAAGDAMAIVRWTGQHSRLEYPIGTAVLDVSVGWIGEPRLSPRGDLVAYVRHPALYDDRGAIAVVDLAGRARDLTPTWLSAQGVAWSASGDEIWFTATDQGTARELRAVTLDGKQRVIAQLPVGLKLEDIAPDGRVLVRRELLELRVAGSDGSGARERDLSWFDSSYVIDMSADGLLLLLGEGGGDNIANDYSVYLRPRDAGPAVRLGDGNPHGLSPDGRWAVSVSKERDRLTLLPTAAGEPRELPVGGLTDIGSAAWFPDGRRILFGAFDGKAGERVFVIDVEGGAPRPLDAQGMRLMVGNPISPDGKQVALVDLATGLLTLVPVAGGTPRRVPGALPEEDCARWAADPRFLYVSKFQSLPMLVYRIELATGRRELWKELTPPDPAGVMGITFWVLSGDAKTYAYSYARALGALYTVDGLR